MKANIQRKLCKYIHCFFVLCIILTSIVPVNVILANHLEWSEYEWKAHKEPYQINIWHKDNVETQHIVYCYNHDKLRPKNGTLYRKATVNNQNRSLLYQKVENTLPYTERETIDKIIQVIGKGYPANERLHDKFPDYTEDQLSHGTQLAVWCVIHNWSEERKVELMVTELVGAMDVANYILSDTEIVDVPNIEISFFEPYNNEYQCLLALEYIPQSTKKQNRIKVKKEWEGGETATIKNYPSIKVNLKRNGHTITFLNLNKVNNWKDIYIDEIEHTEPVVYEITEVDEDGREVENGHKITLKDETYVVTIKQEQENEFVVTNTLYIPPKEEIPPTPEETIPPVPSEYEVGFSKVEINQTAELEGATLQIYEGEVGKGELGKKQALHTWVSTKEMKKIPLKEGSYTMVESQAPLGYEIAEHIYFKVLSNGGIEVKENGVYVGREKAIVRMEDRKEIPPIPPTPEENIPPVPKEYEVSFSKVEINQTEELEGATLQIYEGEVEKGELGEKQALHTWVSTKEQKKISLKEGIYTMVEKQAPLGYEVAENIVFKVLSNSAIQVKENGNWVDRANSMVRMEDRKEIPPIPPTPEENIPPVPKEYEVSFSKVEINQTEELEGATLQIYEGEVEKGELGEKQALHTWVSTKEQKRIALKEGSYTMVEKQAPLGYEVAENIAFKVLSNGAIQVKENGNWVDRANSMVRMEDKKEIPPTLPTPPTPPIPSTPPTPPIPSTPPTPPIPSTPPTPPIPPIPPTEPNKPEEPKPEKPSKPKEPKPEKPSKPKPEKPNQPENLNSNDPNFLMGLYGNRNTWELENSDPNYLMGLKGKPLGQLDLQSSKNPNFGKFSIKGNIVGNGIQDSPKVVKTSDMTKLTWYVMTIMLSTMAIGFYLLRRKI